MLFNFFIQFFIVQLLYNIKDIHILFKKRVRFYRPKGHRNFVILDLWIKQNNPG